MEKKRKNIKESDTDKALAKAGRTRPERPATDLPLAEKDEVKQAEEKLRKRTNNKLSNNKKEE
ncbi:hypothetical protein TH53_08425 [Pedobacter lusitanus]|uniref:Uncharacterized protein n=1 Tax=Pedobacter lusitanus TaxID=1503925 RepID=A0A0D0GN92_9SPHI|nr:hypothetical protein [Pedobacter lusitanus]KIO77655.1 hypothetical protein TH53_08425 [Pedobacter lusitanus]